MNEDEYNDEYGEEWEDYDGDEKASPEEIEDFARQIGIDIAKYPHLMPLIEEGALAPIPPGWDIEDDGVGGVCFINTETGESFSEHPLNDYYKKEVHRFISMTVD